MAVPKKRTSVARKNKRRAGQHHKVYAVQTARCSNCGGICLPAKICPNCGFYKGEAVLVRASRRKQESTEE